MEKSVTPGEESGEARASVRLTGSAHEAQPAPVAARQLGPQPQAQKHSHADEGEETDDAEAEAEAEVRTSSSCQE